MAATPSPLDDLAAVEANLERARLAIDGQRRWAASAVQCVDFYESRQWSDADRQERQDAGRPCLTLNKIRAKVGIVKGLMSSQRQQVVVRPGNDTKSSEEISETLTRVISCENAAQHFERKQSFVVDDGLVGGRGYLDVRVSFETNPLGAIALSKKNPFTIFPDPEASDEDSRRWAFVIEAPWFSLKQLLALYPKLGADKVAILTDRSHNLGTTAIRADNFWYDTDMAPATYFALVAMLDNPGGYFSRSGMTMLAGGAGAEHVDEHRKLIRVLDCQSRESVKSRQWVDLVSGDTAPVPDDLTREQIQAALQWAEMRGQESGLGMTLAVREALMDKWRWTHTAGDILLFDDWSPHNWPTIVPFFPYFRDGVTQGIVEPAIDAQIEHNRNRSNAAEILSKAASGGWWVEENSMSPEQLVNVQRYSSSPGFIGVHKQGTKPPQPIVQPNASAPYFEMANVADKDILLIMGINESTLGNVDQEGASGRAVLARQKQSSLQIASIIDSYAEFVRQIGEREIDIVRRFYSEQRLYKERGEDGNEQVYIINEQMADGSIRNDVTQGSYRVTVDTAPSTANFEELAFEQLKELDQILLAKGVPGGIPADILISVANVPRKEEIMDKVAEALAPPMMGPPGMGPPPPGGAPSGMPPGQLPGGPPPPHLSPQEMSAGAAPGVVH